MSIFFIALLESPDHALSFATGRIDFGETPAELLRSQFGINDPPVIPIIAASITF